MGSMSCHNFRWSVIFLLRGVSSTPRCILCMSLLRLPVGNYLDCRAA